MAEQTPKCPPDSDLVALIDGAAEQTPASKTIAHLEICNACRIRFRTLAGDEFPQFGSYTVVGRIGRGGFGVVYRAVHHVKQRSEALKVLYERSPRRAAFFENEVHLVASLRHPGIATLYEAQLQTPPLYYTMELVEGRRLHEHVAAAKPPLPERIRLIRDVADAVGYAHESGVLHRDLKPQNILVDAFGRPRIVDFGIGKRLELAETENGEQADVAAGAQASRPPAAETGGHRQAQGEGPIGTKGFIAPEQAARGLVDARADVFALGVLLFCCVTGRPPTLATRPRKVKAALRASRVRRWADLAAIIDRCVQTSPDDRYPNCRELIADLDNYLEGRWVAARFDRLGLLHAVRIGAYMLRRHHVALQTGLIVLLVAGLSLLFASFRTRWVAGTAPTPEVVIASFDQQTFDAIQSGELGNVAAGIDPAQPKSFRLLHAAALERLSAAGPRAIVLDYYFPDCWPQYDEALALAIRRSAAPVVAAADSFDEAGAPRTCPDIRETLHAVGAILSAAPRSFHGQFELALCVQRGFEPPIPSLALVGYAAARRADSHLRLHITRDELELRYEKAHAPPGEARWHPEIDVVAVHRRQYPPDIRDWLRADDVVLTARILDRPARGAPPRRVVTYLSLLRASPEDLSEWFADRLVLLGMMRPGVDQHALAGGGEIYGVEVQAQMLDSLLAGVRVVNFSRTELVLRVAFWCLLAALIAGRIPVHPRWRLRTHLLLAMGASGLAAGLAMHAVQTAAALWWVELVMAAAVTIAAGGVLFAVRAVRTYAEELRPEDAAPAEGRSTATGAALAEARTSTPTIGRGTR